MKKSKIILLIVFIIAIGGLSYGFYMYNKPSKKVSEETPEIVISASKLINDFSSNTEKMNLEFLDKVVQITGVITLVESNNESKIIILDNAIKCELNNLEVSLNKGAQVTVKGLYTGYDDMFNELSLVKCHIIK